MDRLKQAYAKLRVGRWSEAEELFWAEIKSNPWNPELHFGLGVSLEQQDKLEEALKHYKQAHRGRPERLDFQAVLARSHQALGEHAEALNLWVALARVESFRLEAYARMAEICMALGQPVDAERALKQVVQIRPEEDSAWLTLGQIQLAQGRDDDALDSLGRLIRLRPDLHQVHNELGRIHLRAGRLDAAELCFRTALEKSPDYVMSMNNLASLLQRKKRTEEALGLYERALALPDPKLKDALAFNYAHCLSEYGRTIDARRYFSELIEMNPSDPRVLWSDLTAARVVLDSHEQIDEERARFSERLDSMSALLDDVEGVPGSEFFDPILPSFHLHYHSDPVVDLQTRYGRLLVRAAGGMQSRIPPIERSNDGRIRVGFVSAHFRRHTVSKLFTGWIRELDTDKFDVRVYHICPWIDLDSRALAKQVEFHHLPGALDQTALRIARDANDVLIYPEVGMDADILRLAALRLAPLQCMAWGHPVSSGLPTMDLFLSSEKMEPDDSGEQYTEERVLLPGLSVCLSPPIELTEGLTRAGLGLPTDRVIVISCQTLSKYRPEHDHVWTRIAESAPEAILVFISHPSPVVTETFGMRLAAAFQERGLRMQDHVQLLPRLQEGAYRDLNRVADLYLDSIGWSGGNTTIEAVHHGLPVVTTPGTTMRSRHTAAIMSHIGLQDHVSVDVEAYIERACRLIANPELRAETRSEMETASSELWGDTRPVRFLEQLFQDRISSR